MAMNQKISEQVPDTYENKFKSEMKAFESDESPRIPKIKKLNTNKEDN